MPCRAAVNDASGRLLRVVTPECLGRTADFLRDIGIEMRYGVVDVPTLFPGVLLARGALVVDATRLLWIGDVLHEAAHVALAPPSRRGRDFAFLDDATGGEEVAAIAWCWAALLRLRIDPEEVFHGTAYKRGDSETIITAARSGVYIGFPLLQYWQMAFDQEHAPAGVSPFPNMVRWVREVE